MPLSWCQIRSQTHVHVVVLVVDQHFVTTTCEFGAHLAYENLGVTGNSFQRQGYFEYSETHTMIL